MSLAGQVPTLRGSLCLNGTEHFLSRCRLELRNVYLQSSVETLTFFWSRSAVAGVGSESRHTAGELQGKHHVMLVLIHKVIYV